MKTISFFLLALAPFIFGIGNILSFGDEAKVVNEGQATLSYSGEAWSGQSGVFADSAATVVTLRATKAITVLTISIATPSKKAVLSGYSVRGLTSDGVEIVPILQGASASGESLGVVTFVCHFPVPKADLTALVITPIEPAESSK
jgi:hypothetical protein